MMKFLDTVTKISLSTLRVKRLSRSIVLFAMCLSLGNGPMFAQQAKTHAAAKSAAKLTLSPVSIDAVHEGDTNVTGFSPVPNVALSAKINGAAGTSSANANAAGRFAIVLAGPAHAGNFVEISGVAPNGILISGVTTVLAAGAQAPAVAPAGGAQAPAVPSGNPPAATAGLSAPSIAPAHDGDSTITVSANSADTSKAGLTIHINVPSSDRAKSWEGDCTPDPKTGSCIVTPGYPPLASGQVIQLSEYTVSGGAVNSRGPAPSFTVSAAQGLSAPTGTAAEGTKTASVTPSKADAGRTNLMLVAQIGQDASQNCIPDSAGDACRVTFPNPLASGAQIQIWENAGNATSPKATISVTPIDPLSKPTIAAPHQGDKSVTVTLNSTDVANVKPPVQLGIQVKINRADGSAIVVKPAKSDKAPDTKSDDKYAICWPNDSTNSCQIPLPDAEVLLDGDVVTAWEVIDHAGLRPTDPAAIATTVNDTLNVPSVSKVVEGATSATITLNQADFQKWGGKLSIAVDVYSGDTIVPGQSNTCAPDATKDNCTVTFTALQSGQAVHAREIPNSSANGTPSQPGPDTIADVEEIGYNWGRIRAYFSLGTVFARNNITSTNGVAMVGPSNFSSPEAFAAFDMDFNWFTSQGCLSASYVGKKSLTFATLADAVAQCDWSTGKTGSKSAASTNSGVNNLGSKSAASTNSGANNLTASGSLDAALDHTLDPSTARILEFLKGFTKSNMLPERVKVVVEALQQACHQSDTTTTRALDSRCKEALYELTSLELTPHEAQMILVFSDGFERRRKWGTLVNSYFQGKLTQTAASNGFALTTSPNSFHVEGGIYAPFYFPWSRWTYQHQPYGLFVAPIGKLGFDSLRGFRHRPVAATSQPLDNHHRGATKLQQRCYGLE